MVKKSKKFEAAVQYGIARYQVGRVRKLLRLADEQASHGNRRGADRLRLESVEAALWAESARNEARRLRA